MSVAETAYSTRRYRVSYHFEDVVLGDRDAIARAIRNLMFEPTFQPEQVNSWRVEPVDEERYRLVAERTIAGTFSEDTQRAAIRAFLYGFDLPDTLDLLNLTVELVDDEPVTLAAAA